MAVYLTEAKSQRDVLIDKIWEIYEIVARDDDEEEGYYPRMMKKYNADFDSEDPNEGFFSTMSLEDLNSAYAELVADVRASYDYGKGNEIPSELFNIKGLFDQTSLIKGDLEEFIKDNFRFKGKVNKAAYDKIITSLAQMLKL